MNMYDKVLKREAPEAPTHTVESNVCGQNEVRTCLGCSLRSIFIVVVKGIGINRSVRSCKKIETP